MKQTKRPAWKTTLKVCIYLLLLFLLLYAIYGTGSATAAAPEIQSIEDVNGKDMGCMSGSIFDQVIKEQFPDSKIIYFNSRSELLLGLKSNKIAGFISDEPVAMMMCADNPDVTYLEKAVGYVDYGLCFSDAKLDVRNQFNEYLQEISDNGHLRDLQNKWICTEGASKKKEEYDLTGENGTLMCCTTPDAAPFSFVSENVFQGYEVEMLNEFAYKYGYDIKLDTLSFDALLTAVSTGKYDIALNGIYITPERAESVNFCMSHYRGNDVVMTMSGVAGTSTGFIESLGNSVYRNFIEEDRYQLILVGLLNTIVISVLSIILGTVLGFLFFFLSRLGDYGKEFLDDLQKLLSGLPMMVILMVLFYVVFNSSSISGIIVSIIGFGAVFGTTVYGLLKSGVDSIDKGQNEAALALGYSKRKALTRMVLPQAIRVMFPTYQAEVINLVKNTSIVGYVSVSDLTRMSDIIRGRTYDALLPLILVGILYFAISALLIFCLKQIQKRTLKKRGGGS